MTKQTDGGMQDRLVFRPIGYVRSLHDDPKKTPIQPPFAQDCVGYAEVFPKYEEGLRDIEGFSHVIVLYHFDRVDVPEAGEVSLTVKPFLEDRPHGVFATRYPRRPNPIGLSVLRLIKREGSTLVLGGIDILDGTPILDIKPFVSRFDQPENVSNGWVDGVDEQEAQLRGRRGTRSDESNHPHHNAG